MAATIQTIHKPTRARALDTSGNNNHGQIYSGRALEFDGVSDYLDLGTSVVGLNEFAEGTPYTWSVWINFASFGGGKNWFMGHSSSHPNVLAETSGRLVFRESGSNASYFYLSSGNLDANTWYRLTVTADTLNNMKLYLNGVLDYTLSEGDSPYSGSGTFGVSGSNLGTGFIMTRLGSGYSNNAYPLDGKMSNFQIWDAAWSASDVLYDYLNPEQLALNRGGTSLTESNLKAWYPMQDGHRGQQSFILDGSNTGLGDEMIVDGDFPNGDNWTLEADWSISGGKAHVDCSGVTRSLSKPSFPVTSGKTYIMSLDVSNYVTGTLQIQFDGQIIGSTSSDGNWYAYVTSTITNPTLLLYALGSGGGTELSVANVSLKPVNAKNHATTVFLGDELITNGDFGSSYDWNTGAGTPDTAEVTGGQLHIVDDDDENMAVYHDAISVVAGRNYYWSIQVYKNDVARLLTFGFTTTTDVTSTNSICTGTTSAAINYNSGALETHTGTFTCDTSGSIYPKIIFNNAAYSREVYADNLSLKEVGTATGWTDADQQLDIPQTALQSYNQLAWFDGEDNDAIATVSAVTGTNSFSFSAWVNLNLESGESNGFARHGGGYETATPGWTMSTNSAGAPFLQFGTADTVVHNGAIANATALSEDRWYHVVGTFSRSGNFTFYTNGSINGDTVDLSGQSDDSISNGTTLNIGAVGTTGTNYPLGGCITEVSYWSVALSSAEVQELYNDGKALNALDHSNSNLMHYWRNNGLASWQDLANSSVTTYNAAPDATETLLIPAGVDGSRDNQGFLMNRQKDTNALNLTGGDYVDTLTIFQSTFRDSFTISFWCKPSDGQPSVYEILFGSENSSSEDKLFLTLGTDGKLDWIYESNNIQAFAESASAVFSNGAADWTHIACVADNTAETLYLYKDGSLVSLDGTNDGGFDTNSVVMSNFTTVDELFIGARDANGTAGSLFTGEIDDFVIYSDALTLAEIKRNYNAGKRSHR